MRKRYLFPRSFVLSTKLAPTTSRELRATSTLCRSFRPSSSDIDACHAGFIALSLTKQKKLLRRSINQRAIICCSLLLISLDAFLYSLTTKHRSVHRGLGLRVGDWASSGTQRLFVFSIRTLLPACYHPFKLLHYYLSLRPAKSKRTRFLGWLGENTWCLLLYLILDHAELIGPGLEHNFQSMTWPNP